MWKTARERVHGCKWKTETGGFGAGPIFCLSDVGAGPVNGWDPTLHVPGMPTGSSRFLETFPSSEHSVQQGKSYSYPSGAALSILLSPLFVLYWECDPFSVHLFQTSGVLGVWRTNCVVFKHLLLMRGNHSLLWAMRFWRAPSRLLANPTAKRYHPYLFSAHLSHQMQGLVCAMISVDPEPRPTVEVVLDVCARNAAKFGVAIWPKK